MFKQALAVPGSSNHKVNKEREGGNEWSWICLHSYHKKKLSTSPWK